MDDIRILWPYLIRMLPSGVVLAGTLILYLKTKASSALIMFISEILIFLTIPIQAITIIMYSRQMDRSGYSVLQTLTGSVSMVAYLVFGIALISFATNYIKQMNSNKTLDSF